MSPTPPPTTRIEAIAEITHTRADFFSGIFAVVRETQMLDALMERLHRVDPGWAEHLEREIRLQLVAWGKSGRLADGEHHAV